MKLSMICLVLTLTFMCQSYLKAEQVLWHLMHQTDYDILPHHIELIWYNKSYVIPHQLEFVKFNRTYRRTLNASVTLLKEIGTEVTVKAQLLKLVGLTYKFFPITVTIDVCKELEKNSFHLKELLSKYTNAKLCPQKPGYVKVTYLDFDTSTLPPYIPHGTYQNIVEMFNGQDKFIVIHLFGDVVAKEKTV